MEIRALKALLGALQAAGVRSYRDGDVTIEFADAGPQVPEADVEVDEELKLPAGVVDPRKALQAVYEKHAKKVAA
jgi:hypothetical protein